ncbi:MAG: T9SS type A sorting domain-containing protein [Phaeodactylibacter sp.]|nr:T9SS type A sorting domain-containing protein [Phaeodactylibacter sp.]MCB9049248.1 T9SS type A sorting domain-containing protein [Lewinellaceae bacterium]
MKRFLLLYFLLSAAAAAPSQVMFPGDLNNDGSANHFDLLPLGVAYNRFGPPRQPASLEWIPQENIPWPDVLPVSGVNLGFVDADGNGLIDTFDLEAIALNYDSLQDLAFPEPRPYILSDTFFVENPPELRLRFEPNVAAPGDTVRLIVEYIVPDPGAFPPTALPLGIAFSIGGLDTLPIAPSVRIFPDTLPGDLMYVAATESQAQFWRSVEPGRIEFAAAGRGMGALANSRKLAEMLIVMEDMILPFAAPVNPDSILLINTLEQVIALKAMGDTLTVSSRALPAPTAFASAFPNPARHFLQVQTERPLHFQLTLFTPAGQAVRRQKTVLAREAFLDTGGLPPGMYFLEIRTAEGVQVEKVILQ